MNNQLTCAFDLNTGATGLTSVRSYHILQVLTDSLKTILN